MAIIDLYTMTEEELHSLQEVQRDLIREVDRICKKHGIHYNMVGGTMLGAIRHKGYIPWDDDADIGFLRAEYEKFREVCKTELDTTRYYLQDFRDTDGYRWGYGKLRRRNTEFLRAGQEFMPFDKGISIDLMPFDNVPDSFIGKRIHFFICFLFRKFLWSQVGARVEEKRWIRWIYSAMNFVPEKVIKKSFSAYILFCRQLGKTKDVRILTFPTPKGVWGYERRHYTVLSMYQFDDLLLPGARDYDSYLSVKYGDYMKLPPVEKRKIHPISKLVLPKE